MRGACDMRCIDHCVSQRERGAIRQQSAACPSTSTKIIQIHAYGWYRVMNVRFECVAGVQTVVKPQDVGCDIACSKRERERERESEAMAIEWVREECARACECVRVNGAER